MNLNIRNRARHPLACGLNQHGPADPQHLKNENHRCPMSRVTMPHDHEKRAFEPENG